MPKRIRDENEKKPKPKKTRRSGVEQEIRGGDTSGETRVRTSIIPTALSTLLRTNDLKRKSITRTLDRLARYGGTYRHLTGIFGAHVLLRLLEQGATVKVDKTFYDRCWASLDHEAGGSSRKNVYSVLCREFLTASEMDPSLFPPTMKSPLRQQITRDMETSATNLVKIHTMARIIRHIHFRLANNDDVFGLLSPASKYALKQKIYKCVIDKHFMGELEGLDFVHLQVIDELRNELRQPLSQELDKPLAYDLKKSPEVFYRVLAHISRVAEQTSEIHLGILESIRNKPKSERKGLYKRMERDLRVESRVKIFSLTPMWKLQPCFVQYSSTCINSAFEGYGEVASFVASEFDVSGVRRKGYKVSGFRSDGFQVHLSFIALANNKPVPTNTDKLKDAGYDFPKPTMKVVSTCSKPGVFTVSEKRVDAKKVPVDERAAVRTTVIDPGCVDVVSVRTTNLETTSPSDILKDSTHWALSSEDYTTASGTSIQTGREAKRRSRPGYREALRDEDKGRSKTANLDSLLVYTKWVGRHFEAMYREKNTNGRRRTRFITSRLLQGTIDKLANRIVDSGKSEFPSTTSNVVFFGNGSFKAMRGTAPVPRKKLVRALAMRTTVFMLDEFRTSKMCPGGCGSLMEDVEGDGGYRMRRCSNVSDAGFALTPTNCSLWAENSTPFVCNRDESATINMTKCCHASLCGRPRPPTLCRSS